LPTTPIDHGPEADAMVSERAGVPEAAGAPRPAPPIPAPRAGGTGRWWAGVLVAAVVAIPLTWLLSFAATLPFFIGIFFFALFGLVIGAAVYRVAAKTAPYSRGTVLAGTTLIVLGCWIGSVYLESARFPDDVADFAIENARDIGDRTAAEFRAEVAENTRRYLRETYPPGGILGYAKWSLLSSRLTRAHVPHLRRPFRSDQAKIWWAVRVVLSIGLLAFGVSSQTLPLSAARQLPEAGARENRSGTEDTLGHAAKT